MLSVRKLRCEYLENPIGLDVERPRVSWQLESDNRGTLQTAYQIQVSADGAFQNLVYDSKKENTHASGLVELEGVPTEPFTRFYYRVKVWDQDGNESDWSDVSFWETGMLHPENWEAEWIAEPLEKESINPEASPYMRKAFAVEKEIKEARIYATSLGLYELELNGKRVGDMYFTPGWTSYDKRLQYQTYDVTELLNQGKNAIGMIVGNGWYKGYFGFEGKKEIYGSRRAGLLELHITYGDGSKEKILTNKEWEVFSGPIQLSEIYHGETYDARLENESWSTGSFEAEDSANAEILNHKKSHIVYQQNEPVRKIDYIKPKELIVTPEGDTVLDMGQNMVGWMKFTVKGERGKEVTLRHAEILDRDGNFYLGNIRSAKQTISYVLKGDEAGETFEPHFTFQGFRYVKLQGFPEAVKLDDFTGVVLHSDMEPAGSFECSNPLINQLHHNIVWGQKGNFLDVPTDCPQRDERLGWTGDAQMFIRTASYLHHVGPFFTKWLKDLEADQLDNGGVPYVIPNIIEKTSGNLGGVTHSVAAWGDAAVICPWSLYVCYGDKRILEKQYSSMKGWVEYIRAQGEKEEMWDTGFQLGDWLGLDSEPDMYTGATDKTLIATAFYAYSTELLGKTADILNKQEDVRQYAELRKRIVEAFRKKFLASNGRLTIQTQTAHVLTLVFNLVDEETKPRIAGDLVELIKERNYHLTTGFVGAPYLNLALSQNGYHDVACKLLLQTDYPSWLYQVTKGATTVWEHWDSIKEDGSFWSDDMNSFNHYAYGSIGEWLYKVIAGIDTDEKSPGYKHIVLAPQPGADLDWIEAKYDSLNGEIISSWKWNQDILEYSVTIPANTTATLILPEAADAEIKESNTPIADVKGVKEHQTEGSTMKLEIGSGNYHFSYRSPALSR